MSKLKVGIIGCGGISNNKHMPAIKKAGYAEIVAFCDIIEERAVKSAKEFGNEEAKVFIDYKELLKEDLDAVYVCTPNRSHAMISVDALHSGKHVMCEKPMALNYEEACLMVNAAKETGKILTIGYQNRYRADSQYLKQECEDGALGEIYYAKAKAIRRRAVPTWGVFLNEYEQGGGPLIDIGTHALDLTLWTMGNYKPKYAVGTTYHKLNQDTDQGNAFGPWKSDEFTVEDSAFGFVVMDNGATITLEASWALNTLDVLEASTVLCGTKAGADMQDGLRINGIKHDKQYVTKPDLAAGGVAFFEGTSASPDVVEQIVFGKAILGEGELTVLPE
ncbi:MAG TPA: oxidoreductase, partial [Eubacteriaceae bacterium]|nr:oxidoreductase [Eubacteriaceae bacterium]